MIMHLDVYVSYIHCRPGCFTHLQWPARDQPHLHCMITKLPSFTDLYHWFTRVFMLVKLRNGTNYFTVLLVYVVHNTHCKSS